MPNRWWTYQQERFPLFRNGILIAVFSTAAVGYSWLLRGRSTPFPLGAALIAFLTLLLFFLQLRIADEFKDYADDARYRPYRAVPRGLVTLPELLRVGIGCAVVQFGLALSMGLPLVGLLAIAWLYFGLMSKEFFAPAWLKAHPLVYLLSHMLIMPLLALYASACDWLAAGAALPAGLGWFLAVSFCNGLAIELGRKMRAPEQEETGVETYTALWGRLPALAAWLTAIWLSAIATFLAAARIHFSLPVYMLVLLLLTGAVWVAWQFHIRPATAPQLEVMAGVWTLGTYVGLGLLPLLLPGLVG